ncbi:MAG: hypothetical protein EPN53_09425 [Acidobacteria bacterium]|nr:MAG: hypothetical protein EPN53_09425 [Acidobacteriota bacterium]
MPRRTLCTLLLFASGAVCSAADPSLFGGLHWRMIGPFRGGRVLAVSGVPGQPDRFYFGAVSGGVWETRDAGRTWRPIFDGQPVNAIGALAVAASDPAVLYVGTGEADMRSDITQGDGVYRSSDGGRTWAHVGLDDSQQIGRILVDPRDANRVFVAALGHPYGPNPERGVFRTTDGGRTWAKVLGPDGATGAVDLAFEPGRPDTLYAALWQARRTPWSVYPPLEGPGSGLWKSVDGGDHWTRIEGGGFPARTGRIGLAVARSRPSRVYALVDSPEGGLYRSDDAGATWTRTSNDSRIWSRGWYFGSVTVDPANADRVFVPNTILLRSDDGGRHFVAASGDLTGDDFHELWIDPTDPERQIVGSDQGAQVTVNGGRTWSSRMNQPTAQIYHVATDRGFPYRVYGAQQDSGAVSLPAFTPYAAVIGPGEVRGVTAGGESGMIAPDPDDPAVVFGGAVDRLDLRTQQTRSVDPTLAAPGLYRRAWTLPLAFSRRPPKTLYFANQVLFATTDGGDHWSAISPDLTRERPGSPPSLQAAEMTSDAGAAPRRGVIYAVAPSPLDGRLLWVGTDDGLVWRSADAGAHWTDVTPAALTPWSKVAGIEASHFDAATAYVAVDRHRLEDRRPYLYRTRDGGRSWQPVAAGIRDGDFVNAVREDPKRRGLLFAATELGVWVSFDDGDVWQPLQLDLPRVSVRDLEVHGDDLVIATHGRGFWILDGIGPLRQIGSGDRLGETRLFQPSRAIRLHPATFTGTPLPKDEPTAPNPPFGAWIDYVLAAAPRGPITLEIRDAAGELVRRYSSADLPPAVDAATSRAAPEWVPRPSVLAATPGMHRFVWPLRRALPPELAHGNAYADGRWVPPGRYGVELDVDGQAFRQPLEVDPDPRVVLPAAAYARQAALAAKVEDAQVRLARAQAQAQDVHKALLALRGDARLQEARLLDEQVVALAEITATANPANTWAVPVTSVESFRFLEVALRELLQAVDGADADPSPDAVAGSARLDALLSASLADWEELRTRGLALEARAHPGAVAPGTVRR